MKADGLDYDQRMAELESVTHPRPLAELLEPMFEVYRGRHPWVAESPLSPKAVVREMWERAMGFADYVRFHQIARAEGTLLRYLTDAYRTLVKTVPEETKTDELIDLTEWLGELVRQVDSSLLDEWEALSNPPDGAELTQPVDHTPPPLTANRRAFSVLVRNAMFQRVEMAALRRWDALGDLDGDEGWTPQRWFEALAPYFGEHASIDIDADARNPIHLTITEQPGTWLLRQTLCDPAGDHDWALVATVDLARSDEEGEAIIAMVSVERLTGLTG